MKDLIEVLIVGAGQAGLATAYRLKEIGISCLIVDQISQIGDSWRNRYDSLRLLTENKFNSLPGFPIIGNPNKFPTKDQFANYLKSYAQKHSLPVSLNTKIIKLTKTQIFFIAHTSKKLIHAKKVIIATGPFQTPFIPKIFKSIPTNIEQLHSDNYKNPSQIKHLKILVVGAGHSGTQIAYELSKSKKVTLAAGKSLVFNSNLDLIYKIAFRIVGENLIKKIVELLDLRRIKSKSLENALKEGKIVLKEKLIKVEKKAFFFQDGSVDNFGAVIWATGFKFDYSWIKIPNPFNTKGLYFVYPKKDYGFIKNLPDKIDKVISQILENEKH